MLVTRPGAQATDWVERLRALNIDAVALPLISIAPPADPSAVRAAWLGLAAQQLLVFVSPNAAECFFALQPEGTCWPSTLHAASTGPGTSHTLQRLGVPRSHIVEPVADSAQLDSQALWAQLALRDCRGVSVLIVRGNGGREWLTRTLREHGANVQLLTAYRRMVPRLNVAEQELLRMAMESPAKHLWLFSSAQAIGNLAAFTAPYVDWSSASAIATHPRIVARGQELGLGRVFQSRPTLNAVVACIQSIAL